MAYDDLMRVAMETVRTRTQSDLEDVHDQVLPAGVEVRSVHVPVQRNQGFPPSSPTQLEQEEDESVEEELPIKQRAVVFIDVFDYSEVMQENNSRYDDLVFQLFFRDKLRKEDIDMVLEQPDDLQKNVLIGYIKKFKE